jgi:hypothetical protein
VLKEDLAGAIEIIQSILHQANASIAREEREDALLDLNDRVEDWKSLRIESFGELMMFGTFSVLKGDGGGKDQEKEVSFCSMSFFAGPNRIDYFNPYSQAASLTSDLLVPHLSISTYTSLLQGYEHEQAEGENQIYNQSSRQASTTVKRKNISCQRDACDGLNRTW